MSPFLHSAFILKSVRGRGLAGLFYRTVSQSAHRSTEFFWAAGRAQEREAARAPGKYVTVHRETFMFPTRRGENGASGEEPVVAARTCVVVAPDPPGVGR